MIIVLRLKANSRCEGCGAHGYVDNRMLLCLACCNIKLLVAARHEKLSSTLRYRFAHLGRRIKEQMKEWR